MSVSVHLLTTHTTKGKYPVVCSFMKTRGLSKADSHHRCELQSLTPMVVSYSCPEAGETAIHWHHRALWPPAAAKVDWRVLSKDTTSEADGAEIELTAQGLQGELLPCQDPIGVLCGAWSGWWNGCHGASTECSSLPSCRNRFELEKHA